MYFVMPLDLPDAWSHIEWLGHAADPKPGGSYETGSDGAAGRPPGSIFRKKRFFERFWLQEWSGWLLTGRRIHVVFVSGQTVDSRPIPVHFQ